MIASGVSGNTGGGGPVAGIGRSGNSIWNSIKGWVSRNVGVTASIENSHYTGYYWLFETEAGYGWETDNGKPINFTFDGPAQFWKIWDYSV